MMLDLESVRLFVLVVDLGSLTRAAEAAGTVQPVVSQRLKALEAALGRKVLERTPRFVRLTQDGAIFYPAPGTYCRRMMKPRDLAMNPRSASRSGLVTMLWVSARDRFYERSEPHFLLTLRLRSGLGSRSLYCSCLMMVKWMWPSCGVSVAASGVRFWEPIR